MAARRKPLTDAQIADRAVGVAGHVAHTARVLAYPEATITAIIKSAMIEARDGIAK